MSSVIRGYGKRIIAMCCAVLLIALQVVFVVPVMHADADSKAGENLEVRVQYEGERGGKIRTIAVFSNSELESLGAYDAKYVNITRVGTLMKTAAHVVNLTNIIEAAGIDIESVKSFTFRATDGYTMTFGGEDYLGTAGWYYPALGAHAHRTDVDGDGYVQMEAGALEGATHDSIPALAIKSNSIKSFKTEPSFESMSTRTAYRFLTGQTDLSYLKYEDENGSEAFEITTDHDITAWDSVKYIYGIDIVLKGTPPLDGISLDVLGDDMKVGSQVQVQVTFEGDTLGIFSSSDVTWFSSDDSIATVDKNGIVTIHQEKEVTITAEAAGKTASVTINSNAEATDNKTDSGKNGKSADSKTEAKAQQNKIKATTKPANTDNTKPRTAKKEDPVNQSKRVVLAREISIGDEIKPEPEVSADVSVKADAQALEGAEAYDKKIVAGSAAAAVLACSGGAVFRIRRFRIDLIKK